MLPKKFTMACLTLLSLGLIQDTLANSNLNHSNKIYCPSIAAIQATVCHSGAINTGQLKFPLCLILLGGQKFSFGSSLLWEIASISPALTSDTQLQFYTAYFDKEGIFCAYRGTIDNVYVRLQYTESTRKLMPSADSQWELNTPSARQPYKEGSFNRANDYICVHNKHDVTNCPMLLEN